MSRRRKTPGHTADDRALWARVTQTVTPLHGPDVSEAALMSGDGGATHHDPEPAAKPDHVPRVAPFRVGSRARTPPPVVDRAPDPSRALEAAPPRVDGRTHARLRRGKLRPEARIDLHGMTLDQAHPTLTGFILGAHAMGRRLVLVITGKGQTKRPRDAGMHSHGVLKRQVPQWLRMAPLGSVVLQISEAHQSHGGSGAYYVYLRRNR